MTSSFHLTKWYLDCVSDTGDTAIGYSAGLSWKSLALSSASYLKWNQEQGREEQSSLFQCRQPELTADGITWNSEGLSCRGTWRPTRLAAIPPVVLYENSAGSVTWHCLQPLADVRFQINGDEYAGLGYVERLDMTLAPWRLPIRELHWGRFLSHDSSLIWIEWRGPHPLTLVYLNGEKLGHTGVSPTRLSWGNGRLDMRDQVVLRNGPIVKTALAHIPGVKSLFPEALLQTHECKWRSQGELLHEEKRCTGWVIHEIVRFG